MGGSGETFVGPAQGPLTYEQVERIRNTALKEYVEDCLWELKNEFVRLSIIYHVLCLASLVLAVAIYFQLKTYAPPGAPLGLVFFTSMSISAFLFGRGWTYGRAGGKLSSHFEDSLS